ncbi:GH92 family glycosyl hydrolase [Tengunoibacter tsumagoiensis]|nr:GH92 family glycosyl hydrolase [Tengunoibacter tsumagoiensis]
MMRTWVDPFIGIYSGQCLCGPYLPYSLVRLGPDTIVGRQSTNGYGYGVDGRIARFSHTHVSGTGGPSRYGNVGFTPFIGPVDAWRSSPLAYHPQDEYAEPGYYAVSLQPEAIRAELTVTPHVGVHRYTFPAGTGGAHLLIDAGAVIQWEEMAPIPVLPGDKPGEWTQEYTGASVGGSIEWLSPTDLVGRADCQGGWGHNYPYSVFFALHFDQPARAQQCAVGMDRVSGPIAVGPQSKAIATFRLPDDPAEQPLCVQAWVGISYASLAHACASLAREVGSDHAQATTSPRQSSRHESTASAQAESFSPTLSFLPFDHVRTAAAATWDQALTAITVKGGSVEQRTLFATLFTRLVCMPTDLGIDDEHSLWHSGTRQFTDFYCFWDSVRNANQLISLFDPEREAAFLLAALDIAEHRGWLPDAWIAGHYGVSQGGSTIDILFCEAALKGLPGLTRQDYQRALAFMRKNALVPSPDPVHFGRDLRDQDREPPLAYISTDVPRFSASKHLEYCYQDWCAGTLAAWLGESEVAEAAYARASNVWKLWRDDLRCFAPRQPDGSWLTPFDPDQVKQQPRLVPYFYEATGRQWSFQVFHDFAGLVRRHGGPEAFVEVLDAFFAQGHYIQKETLLHIPYLYHYAGRPDKSAERVRALLARAYHATRNGLSDDEDMGCQSGWYLWSTMGLYPVMGQDLYLITAPTFTEIQIKLGNSGKHLLIQAPEAGPAYGYVAEVRLNGVPLQRSWLHHAEIAQGATLTFTLSPSPTSWGYGMTPPILPLS